MSYHAEPAKIIDLPAQHPIGLIVNTLSASKQHRTVNNRFGHLTETAALHALTMHAHCAIPHAHLQHGTHIAIIDSAHSPRSLTFVSELVSVRLSKAGSCSTLGRRGIAHGRPDT
jgi:hypothetical protein